MILNSYVIQSINQWSVFINTINNLVMPISMPGDISDFLANSLWF